MTVRVVLNPQGVREVLRSEEMQKILEERARSMAAHAPDGCEVEISVGAKRARAHVFTGDVESIVAVAHDPALLVSALEAGR